MSSIPDRQQNMQASALWELQQSPQWVCYIFSLRNGKITKPPINPHEDLSAALRKRLADTTDPSTWGSYEQAMAASRAYFYKGIGFVFSSHDPFCAIDLDDCINSHGIQPWAKEILHLMNSYSEISPSGTGIHILVKANLEVTRLVLKLPTLQHRKGNIELYDRERYLTWSGRHIPQTPTTIEYRQEEINELYFRTFCLKEERAPVSHSDSTFPIVKEHTPVDLTDQELIERAMRSTKFAQLWRGDLAGYTHSNSNKIDYSRADLALCSMLAYWTQKDATRIDRLFRQSKLYRKEKWDRAARSGETYGQGTIRVAIENCYRVYDPSWRPTRGGLRKHLFPQHTIEQGIEERDA